MSTVAREKSKTSCVSTVLMHKCPTICQENISHTNVLVQIVKNHSPRSTALTGVCVWGGGGGGGRRRPFVHNYVVSLCLLGVYITFDIKINLHPCIVIRAWLDGAS